MQTKPEDMFEQFTHRALKVMALANRDAERFGYDQIDTEHIFLGFLQESSGVGARLCLKSTVRPLAAGPTARAGRETKAVWQRPVR